ncbi:MAG: recombinase family protein [Moorea sp. SIO1G6]|uniref:recombinase family protein n=1 Tax=Moorena sp. SIO1G6 TaxID=2607840 RepID=UPI0013C02BC7|nr:recombinase family protein [Moorena sp. SIO1G6]NET68373.1 recombinase family protein [Moorena sp. SIO1G6]
MKVAIYCRVSTASQSCDRQEEELLAYARRAGHEVFGVWKEVESGSNDQRAKRRYIMQLARGRFIDGILVTELTRWGRNTLDLIKTLQDLSHWNVSVIALTGMQFDLGTAEGRLIASVMASIAEFEKNLLGERIRSGMKLAQERGVPIGRQKGVKPKSNRLRPRVLQMVAEGYSYAQISRMLGIGKTSIYLIVKENKKACDRTSSPNSDYY